MCGLLGFLNTNQVSPEKNSSVISLMLEKLVHRGPDASGVWVCPSGWFALGHRRLSIQDLSSAGDQPMVSEDRRFVLAFNGEIYNHLDIRERLALDYTDLVWNGHSDTETLLVSFQLRGVQATLQSLIGMFSIALWDCERGSLTLARDRCGEKPLYWGFYDKGVIFGSELKALKAHPDYSATVDRDSLALLLKYGYVPSPRSIYRDIEKLPAGCFVEVSVGGFRKDAVVRKYWSLPAIAISRQEDFFKGTYPDAVDCLEKVLSDSVERQMISDVPLGAFLSGGIDSSSIVALMKRHSSRNVRTFAIGFGDLAYNEATYAKQVAQHLGTDHTELYVSESDVLDIVPKMAGIYCEPLGDSSQLPTYLVCAIAKREVSVALSGDGADELFGGYNHYRFAENYWNTIRLLPAPLRRVIFSAAGSLPFPDKLAKLMKVLPAKGQDDFFDLLNTHWDYDELLIQDSPSSSSSGLEQVWVGSSLNFKERMMLRDSIQYLPDDVLVKVDRASMAHSLETRAPFLDHNVVEFAWKLPIEMKIRNGIGKSVLKDVLYRYVPKELIDRPKKGFSVPLAAWLRGPLRDWGESLLSDERLRNEGFFNSILIRRAWVEHLSGKRDHSRKLWTVLMFQSWLETQ